MSNLNLYKYYYIELFVFLFKNNDYVISKFRKIRNYSHQHFPLINYDTRIYLILQYVIIRRY